MRERYRAIARVAKAHGKRGEVVAVALHGLPLVLGAGMTVHAVPPALREPRSLRVVACSDSPRGQLLRLEGVDGIEAASRLVGRTLLVSEAELPESFALRDAGRLVGREVSDASLGPLGTIVDVMLGAAHDVWVVEGPLGEVLVPVVDGVVGPPPPEGPIPVTLPAGLVEGGA